MTAKRTNAPRTTEMSAATMLGTADVMAVTLKVICATTEMSVLQTTGAVQDVPTRRILVAVASSSS